MPYTSNKKPGALNQAASVGANDNIIVEQSGDVLRATVTQLETKVFGSRTEKTVVDGSEVVVARQSDGSLRQVPLNNIVKSGLITNAMVSDSASIADTKLAALSTAGKVLNSATTATSANTVNAIVARDGSGNFSAGSITANQFNGTLNGSFVGNVTGNADTATKWATARNLALTGDVTATLSSVDGSAAVSAAATLAATGVSAGTYNDNAAQVRPFTVDAKGRVTAIGAAVPIAIDYSAIAPIALKKDVRLATTANITATYNNGSSGVGATLTISTAGLLSIDGVSVVLGDRVLVKDQTTSTQNGIYSVTNTGSTGVSAVLTRSSDADTASKLASSIVAVDSGMTNGGLKFTTSFKDSNAIGSQAIVWNRVMTTADTVSASMIDNGAITNAKFAGSVGLNAWQTQTANYTAVAGDRINANTTSAAFTITLPATPTDYTEVTLADHAGTWKTNNLTVARNGSNINGLSEDLVCDVSEKQILLRYEGATTGWRIYI